METRIDHIGIAVSDIKEALKLWGDALGLKCEQIEAVSSQKLKSYHLRVGESHIELLTPDEPDSVIARYLEKRGGGIHHIALAVSDFEGERARLIEAGFQPIGEPALGANSKRIQFFHPKTTGGVLLEICSRHSST